MKALIKTFKQLTYKQIIFYILLLLSVVGSLVFVYNNYAFYDRPIAKVIESQTEETTNVTDQYGNEDTMTIQNITAELKNGEQKKEHIQLKNEYSITGAYDQPLETGNELFVSIDKDSVGEKQLTGSITDIKRDKYIVVTAWIFILVLLLVGKRQGLFASVSLAINLIILSYALDLNVKTGMNLLWIAAVTVILFTVISLLLVNGFNEKTYAAILATLLGTFSSLLITYIAMTLTSDTGLHYEEMQFLTRPYRLVFLAGLFIGSLGAVMDVAITMSSAIFELYEKDHHISVKALKTSALDIGKDIMGTMTNILFFAYISGSMPMLILYLKNYSPLGFTLSMNLSLELARALAGGIGIVLTIPIGLYISIFFVNRKRAKL
ncbi:YibE/F family protein [Virgibacillus sp. MSJ-26]|uniref:YibE/F family protein n=1 Tax=Virgibacillus sp. MSJ-26 TaxID=2841522 RepID=UPI0020A10C95|nr:YibE/F family protein [Virgibacillus sp. MSJ-26]